VISEDRLRGLAAAAGRAPGAGVARNAWGVVARAAAAVGALLGYWVVTELGAALRRGLRARR
jgi:hypothetical protein